MEQKKDEEVVAHEGDWVRVNSGTFSNYDYGREGRVVALDKTTGMLVVVFANDEKTCSVNSTYLLADTYMLDVIPEPRKPNAKGYSERR